MIIEIAALNKGVKPICSELHFLDWYDGPMSGVFRLDQSDRWYAFKVCYLDSSKPLAVFTVIEQPGDWAMAFIRLLQEAEAAAPLTFNVLPFKTLWEAFLKYTGSVYLLLAANMGDVQYEIVPAPLSMLRHNTDIWEDMSPGEDYVELLRMYLGDVIR